MANKAISTALTSAIASAADNKEAKHDCFKLLAENYLDLAPFLFDVVEKLIDSGNKVVTVADIDAAAPAKALKKPLSCSLKLFQLQLVLKLVTCTQFIRLN